MQRGSGSNFFFPVRGLIGALAQTMLALRIVLSHFIPIVMSANGCSGATKLLAHTSTAALVFLPLHVLSFFCLVSALLTLDQSCRLLGCAGGVGQLVVHGKLSAQGGVFLGGVRGTP